MFTKKFVFGNMETNEDMVRVSKDCLYDEQKGYGFVIEKNRNSIEKLKISELNAAFEIRYWLAGKELTEICSDDNGCYLEEAQKLPLTFKLDVPSQGNYNVKIVIENGDKPIEDFLIFSERRRCMYRTKAIEPMQHFEYEFTVNVCDIVPRGKTESYEDKSLDITVIGNNARISKIYIEEADVPTVYIAGDSTVTDQSAAYPYLPECSYSGWAQMFPSYFKKGIAISNHAHSGLTTESFRSEGHYAIVQKYIKKGDIFFMQFAHNDQKLPHLKAMGGYAENIRRYVNEVREKGAFPVIVTPLSRTTWRGTDGGFNDLLIDFANACKFVGEEMNVPVLDLHARSVKFITSVGLEDSKRFYFPKDYTHSNDYGAYLMANYVVEEIIKIKLPVLSDYVVYPKEGWAPPINIVVPQPPADYTTAQEETESSQIDRPNDIITRVEALDLVIKAVKFVPTNVYNDMYEDVVGHEWYAGTVECAYANVMVDEALIDGKKFKPNSEVTYEELISYCINGYRSRKKIEKTLSTNSPYKSSDWAKKYVAVATDIKLIDSEFVADKKMSRKETLAIVNKLIKLI